MIFAILCTSRSGSTYISNKLDTHLQIKSLGEIFNRDSQHFRVMPNNPYAYMKEVEKSSQEEVVGCKLVNGSQGPISRLFNKQPDVKKIYLIRENIFERAISEYLASKAKNWIDYSKDINQPIRIPEDYICRVMRHTKSQNRELLELHRKNKESSILIKYEDLSDELFDKICDFLGVQKGILIHVENAERHKIIGKIINYRELYNKYGACF